MTVSTRLAAIAAFTSLLAACSPPPPAGDPDAGGPIECQQACDPDTQFCNLFGECETRADVKTREALIRVRAGDENVALDAAYVTYVVPSTSDPDLFGFFVQATQEGPGIFVAVDPGLLPTVPKAGDLVRFTVTRSLVQHEYFEVQAIENFEVRSRGNDLGPLVQDISYNRDLLSDRAKYDSELVDLRAEFQGEWQPLARGHAAANLKAEGGHANGLLMRSPESVTTVFGDPSLCLVAVRQVPFRHAGNVAHVWAMKNSDFTVRTCPQARLIKALALSPTEVRLQFQRPIDPATLKSDASQITFSDLSAEYASVMQDGRYVLVVTSTQSSRSVHKVALDPSLQDVLGGKAVVPKQPDSCTDACSPAGFEPLCRDAFHGFFERAKLVINELNCTLPGERDLIELRAVTAGSTADMSLTYDGPPRSGTMAVFPDAQLQAGDIVVVHLNAVPPTDAVCPEILSVDERASPSNYPLAWDFVYEDFTCAYSNFVMRLRNADGAIVDGLAVVREPHGLSERPPEYGAIWLQKLQQDLHWEPKDCNGIACSYFSFPSAIDVSVNWAGLNLNNSIQRISDQDTNSKVDWALRPHTFGRSNLPTQ